MHAAAVRVAGLALVVTLLGATIGAVPGRGQAAAPASPCASGPLITDPAAMPSHELPVKKAFRYRMAGKIRPLLFWIGRDGVGLGQIVWRGEEPGAHAYELLIGTDPATAPRAINRWGYIVEEQGAADTRVAGFITTSEEATLTDVSSNLDKGQAHGRFKAIEARIDKTGSCVATGTVETERDMNLHEVSLMVRRVRERLRTVVPKDTVVPAGVRPGFLTAIAEIMNETAKARRRGGNALDKMKNLSVPYIYGRNLLTLVLVGVENENSPVVPVPAGRYPLHANFEARLPSTGEKWKFELQYATEGDMAGVPILIRYQPRWWLQAELVLEGPDASVAKGIGGGALEPAP